jgi:hypothetical protein
MDSIERSLAVTNTASSGHHELVSFLMTNGVAIERIAGPDSNGCFSAEAALNNALLLVELYGLAYAAKTKYLNALTRIGEQIMPIGSYAQVAIQPEIIVGAVRELHERYLAMFNQSQQLELSADSNIRGET